MTAVHHESMAGKKPAARCHSAWVRRIGLVGLVALGSLSACQHAKPRAVSAASMRVFEPSLASFGDHAIVGWHGGETGGNAIYLQRLDASLSTWSRPIVLTDPTAEAFEPDLQALENDLLVAWYAKDPGQGKPSAQLARLDWSGHVKWRRVLSQEDGRNPVVRVASGNVWVAWIENGVDDSAQVFTQQFSPEGVPLAEPRRAGPASRDTWNLNASVDSEGAFYVIYDASIGSGAKEVNLITVGAHGVRRTLLSGDDGVASTYPDIAVAADRVAISWVNALSAGGQLMLFVGNREALSGPLDAAARPVTQTAGNDSGAYLAWSGSRLAIAWNRTDGVDSRVLVRCFDRNGVALSKRPSLLHRSSVTRAGVPAIGAWHGGFVIAWSEYEQEPGPRGRIVRSAGLVQSIE